MKAIGHKMTQMDLKVKWSKGEYGWSKWFISYTLVGNHLNIEIGAHMLSFDIESDIHLTIKMETKLKAWL